MTNLSDLVGGAPIPAYLGSFKNKVINGGFDLWQRGGDSGDHQTTGTYSADRWKILYNGSMVLNPYRSTGAPTAAESGHRGTYSMRVNVATADTSIAAGDYAIMATIVEGSNIVDLIGKVCTLSFWVRAVTTGTYCVKFGNTGADRSYVAEYTVNSTTTWEYKTITFTMDDGLTGTWDFTNGYGLGIYFIMACGSTYHTTPNSWQSGNYLATSNQVNCVNTTSDHLRLAMVQLEVGPSATQFEGRSFQQELALCQRYFQKSYAQGTDPGTATDVGSKGIIWTLSPSASYNMYLFVQFPVQMRTAPSVITYDSAGNAGKTYIYGDGNNSTTTLALLSTSGFRCNAATTTPSTNRGIVFNWTADAEL